MSKKYIDHEVNESKYLDQEVSDQLIFRRGGQRVVNI